MFPLSHPRAQFGAFYNRNNKSLHIDLVRLYAVGILLWELETHSTPCEITFSELYSVNSEESHFRFPRKRLFNFPLRFTISRLSCWLSPEDVGVGWRKSSFLFLFCSTVLIASWGVAFPEVSYRELFKIGFTSVASYEYFSLTWRLNQARQGVNGNEGASCVIRPTLSTGESNQQQGFMFSGF